MMLNSRISRSTFSLAGQLYAFRRKKPSSNYSINFVSVFVRNVIINFNYWSRKWV